MNTELAGYLQDVVEDARAYHDRSDRPRSAIAVEVAGNQHGLFRNNRGRDNIEVLQDLRHAGYLCADELDRYREQAPSYDGSEATIEAIVRRSLEEMLHEELSI